MSLIRRKAGYDRQRILQSARVAVSRGKRAKAIALYQRVLAVEPENVELHRKLAPLLAAAGEKADALTSFERAVRGLLGQGMDDKAIGVCREIVRFYPKQLEVWEAIARLECERDRGADAANALRTARSHCRGKAGRAEAERLLRRAHEIAPTDVDIATDLSRILRRSGRRHEASRLLAALSARISGAGLRRVRWAQFCTDPSPRSWFAWLRPAPAR